MRCKFCCKRIHCPYYYGMWRTVDGGTLFCYASRTGYHAP
jgi:hypothetical protein